MANPYNPDINPNTGNPWSGNPWSEFENQWAFHQYDNFINGGVIYHAANPGEAQYSEWSQQMTATMYQNWYNSAPEQMKRALEAGINPFVAASGIAGNDASGVAPSPNSVNNKLPELVGSAASLLGSAASGFGSVAAGIATLRKLRPEIDKIDAETQNIFESLGFSKLQSKALQVSLKYMDQKEQIGVWQALADFDKTKAEYNNILANHRNILAQYDEIIARKDLLIAEKGEVIAREELNRAMAARENEITQFSNLEREFFIAHGYKLGTPIYESLRDMMVSNGTFDMVTFGNTVSGYEGKITQAIETEKANASWDYRPSNVAEAAAFIGRYAGEALRDVIFDSNGVTSWSELHTKIYSNKQAKDEFIQAYKDAKDDLYENYLAKKRYYRYIKRGGNTQEVARAKNAMDNARKEYDEFTEEKFGNELLSQTYHNVTSPAE